MSRNTTTVTLAATFLVGVATFSWWNNRRKKKEQRCGRSQSSFAEEKEKRTDGEDETVARKPLQLETASVPREITVNDEDPAELTSSTVRRVLSRGTITVAYASTTGTCKSLAKLLYDKLLLVNQENNNDDDKKMSFVQLVRVEDLDWWDELLNREEEPLASKKAAPPALCFVLPTYTNGNLPSTAEPLLSSLRDVLHDWRVEKRPLSSSELRVAAFGMGSSAYDPETFCKPAKDAVRLFSQLGAKIVGNVGKGDDELGDARVVFYSWMDRVLSRLSPKDSIKANATADDNACACAGEGEPRQEACCNSAAVSSSNPQEQSEESDVEYDEDEEDDDDQGEPEVMDMEDLASALNNPAAEQPNAQDLPEMVTPKQAAALKKEGYKLIGTHSAVKMCRWTKHQLRGRGGCYKHTFYGITSYQCMEATPSLACANKCVFCWRHHKNPVGREWRWKADDPNEIVDLAVQTHVKMIKEARGIPGVKPDRWQEALTVRHCALSLVGEPIMYPRINEFLADLHRRKISTFLVTNGQHPDAIDSLIPITQLYVSVDAPTQDSLIAIDRPLFNDAWDRLKKSLSCLKTKGQRTVARLTVVKGWNSNEVSGYAKLIALGKVSLVEVKGVTFCGKSDASNLNMTNTPWHHEVVSLTQNLQRELDKLRSDNPEYDLPEYGLACEHKHSCSVLLARVDQFAVDDPVTGKRKWRTWIDYDQFNKLAAKHAADASFTFGVEDYIADTPSWALFGAEEEGFDPTDTRHRKKKKHPKYTKFDEDGVPTHDHNGEELAALERARLKDMMEDAKRKIGSGSTVTELRGGEKAIDDASLMFRGLVVTK